MSEFEVKNRYTLEDFVLLVRRLRDKENGCAWDRVQTHDSIRQNFIEEVYEAVDAIDKKDNIMLEEELGDVLLQVALHAEIAKEDDAFDIVDVVNTLCNKLVLRHPHIFSDTKADTSERVLANWEDIKREEKEQTTATKAIEDLPNALPPLMKSQKVQKRAAYVGFDYPNLNYAISDLASEVEELKKAVAEGKDTAEEIGDIIFSAVNVARLVDLDATLVAERACDKFIERFRLVEKAAIEQNINMKECGIDVLNQLWNDAKDALNK